MENVNMQEESNHNSETKPQFYIKVVANGPYMLFGEPKMSELFAELDEQGIPTGYREGESFSSKEPCALCRCGASKKHPYCTGEHTKHSWDSKEKAKHESLLKDVVVSDGPLLTLADNERYCSFAHFCDANGGIWNIVECASTDSEVELAKEIVAHCPSGRLVLWDKRAKKIFEPDFAPQVGLLEGVGVKIKGPIWLRGGIQVIGANGDSYEIRNRVTLCRCGESENKPFCDGSHTYL